MMRSNFFSKNISNFLTLNHFQVPTGALLVWVFMVSVIVSLMPMVLDGPQRSADSNNFLRCVNLMLDQSSLGSAVTGNLSEPWCRAYTGFLLIFSPVVHYFGDNWPWIIAGLNVIFHALAITAATVFAQIILRQPWLTIVTATLLIFSVDILIRVNWPIADSFFFLMGTMAFIGTSLTIFFPNSRPIICGAVATVGLAGITKPHGLIIFAIGISAILFRHKLAKITPRAGALLLGSIIFAIVVSFFLIAFIINPSYQPMTTEDAILKEFLINGQVIEGVYSTYNQGTQAYSIRLKTMLERFFTFFSFFPPHWSIRHISLSAIFFVPVYIGLLLCLTKFHVTSLDTRTRGLICLSTIWVLGFATFAGWFDVSYEFRYRLPIMGVFAFQCVLGISLALSHTIKSAGPK